jgi:hypothetical protein
MFISLKKISILFGVKELSFASYFFKKNIMKLKILFFIIFFSKTLAAEELIIKINTGDCINCMLAANYLDKIDKNIPIKFLFKEDDKRIANKILKELLTIEVDLNKQKLVDDELYKKLSKYNSSSCYLMNNDSVLYAFELKELPQNLTNINNLLKRNLTDEVIFTFADTVAFSSSTKSLFFNAMYFTLDSKFNQLGILKEQKFTILESTDIFNLDDFHQQFNTDTSLTNRYKNILKKYKKWDIEMNQIAVIDNEIHLLCSYYYPLLDKKNLIINSRLFIAKYDKQTSKITAIYPIDETYSEEYEIDATNDFFQYENKWYFSVWKENLKNKNYFLATFEIKNESLIFSSFVDFSLPEQFKKDKIVYDYSHIFEVSGTIFFRYFNDFYTVGVNPTVNKIDFFETKNTFEPELNAHFQIFDGYSEMGLTYLLVSIEKKIYILTYQKVDNQFKLINTINTQFTEYDLAIFPIINQDVYLLDKEYQLHRITIIE